MNVWSEEASLALQGCLDCTLWEEFVQSSSDIDELMNWTGCILRGHCNS